MKKKLLLFIVAIILYPYLLNICFSNAKIFDYNCNGYNFRLKKVINKIDTIINPKLLLMDDKTYLLKAKTKTGKDVNLAYLGDLGGGIYEDCSLPRCILINNCIYILIKGEQGIDTELVLDDGKTLYLGNCAPRIYKYNYQKGEFHSEPIHNNKNTLVLDLFNTDKGVKFVEEKNVTKRLYLHDLFGPFVSKWKKSKGEINNSLLDHPIVSTRKVSARGFYNEGFYYYPAISGIYRFNINNNHDEKLVSFDEKYWEELRLYMYGNSIYLIESNKNKTLIKEFSRKFKYKRQVSVKGRLLYCGFNDEGMDVRTSIEDRDKDELKIKYYRLRIMDFKKMYSQTIKSYSLDIDSNYNYLIFNYYE